MNKFVKYMVAACRSVIQRSGSDEESVQLGNPLVFMKVNIIVLCIYPDKLES